MRNWGWLWIGLGSCCSLACTGGQSGTEGSTPACANLRDNEIGLDDSTPFGTARQLFSDTMTFSRYPASMRWSSPTDGSSVDTFVTLGLSGTPTHAVYTADPSPKCAGGWDLSVDGAILRFQSADGAFNESVSGTLSVMRQGYPEFWGYPDTPFVGTYDIDSATKKFAHPTVVLQTSMVAGSGSLVVTESSDTRSFTVASWITPTGAAGSSSGAGGTGSTIDGGGFGGGGTGAGDSGSGGTTAISDNGGDGGAAGAVAIAGTGAGGAANGAGSGGSN